MHGISALVLKRDAWKTWTYNMWSIGNISVFWLIRKDKSSEIFGIEYIWVLKWFSSWKFRNSKIQMIFTL
ncbi:unnamed protein product [Rhizophagus irregularis]|nr:unnamed protein product [Rhizophagus irregularis]